MSVRQILLAIGFLLACASPSFSQNCEPISPPFSDFNPPPPRLKGIAEDLRLLRNPVMCIERTGIEEDNCGASSIMLWDRRYYDFDNTPARDGGRWHGGGKFWIDEGRQSPPIYIANRRFDWYCGSSREWATMPRGTNWIVVRRQPGTRNVTWIGFRIDCLFRDRVGNQIGGGVACTGLSEAPFLDDGRSERR